MCLTLASLSAVADLAHFTGLAVLTIIRCKSGHGHHVSLVEHTGRLQSYESTLCPPT